MDSQLTWVCECLRYIEHVTRRSEKKSTLNRIKGAGGQHELIAKELFSCALDWFRVFGVASLPEIDPKLCRNVATFSDFCKLVHQLEYGDLGRDTDYIMTVLHSFTELEASWLRRCLLKNLKIGASHTTINEVWPGLIKIFECQLAETLSDPGRLAYPVIAEPKIDGVRCLCFIQNGQAKFLSRGGSPLFNLQVIANRLFSDCQKFEVKLDSGWVLDGELYFQNLQKTLSIVRSSVSEISSEEVNQLSFFVFDILPLKEWETKQFSQTQELRSKIVQGLEVFRQPDSPVKRVNARLINSAPELLDFYDGCLKSGYEGIMVKWPHSVYRTGRTSAWQKFKPFEIDTFKVTGTYPGEGRLSNTLGGLIIETGENVHTNVGGGFSDEQRHLFWYNKDILAGKQIRVKYKEKTVDSRLREPVFLEMLE